MIGRGRASAAVTFLNALFTGIGSAAGIELAAEATVELLPAAQRSLALAPESDSPLVRAVLGAALDRWAPGSVHECRVWIDSQVPVSRGLKSSSAVSVALGRAVAEALGRTIPREEIARLAADVAQAIGLSATGAFDDALACGEPGILVTDNVARRRLRTDPVDPDWRVLLLLPFGTHPPSTELWEKFRALRAEAAEAETAAREGRSWLAMARNTVLVERALGVDRSDLHRRLASAGALSSGVSGMGPAVAAVVPSAGADLVRSELVREDGEVIENRLSTAPPSAEVER